MEVLACGRDAVLVEVGSLADVGAVRAAVAAARERGELAGVIDIVPAARTVLVSWEPGAGLRDAVARVAAAAAPVAASAGRLVIVPVTYDGPDLDLVAATAGVPADEVVRLHTGVEYTVAFCGFAPGFGYLTGLPDVLRQPRLAHPRTRVPAGAVGIAGEFTGVYPRPSPGGWRLLGTTAVTLFDAAREPAALLAPGDRVRFEVAR